MIIIGQRNVITVVSKWFYLLVSFALYQQVSGVNVVSSVSKLSPSTPGLITSFYNEWNQAGQIPSGCGGIGDVNGDTHDDYVIGRKYDDTGTSNVGSVYVLMMVDNAVTAYSKIWVNTMSGMSATLNDRFGYSVAGIGDLDNDNIPDIAVGAEQRDHVGSNTGSIFIIALNNDGSVKQYQEISNTLGGCCDYDIWSNDAFGSGGIETLGDIDGDSVVDLVVGTPHSSSFGTDLGAVRVLFLSSDLTSLADVRLGVHNAGFVGDQLAGQLFGSGVAGLDLGTIAVGASNDGAGMGVLYIFDISTGNRLATPTAGVRYYLSDLSSTTTVTTASFGEALASAGDIDGNGADDVIVGAPMYNEFSSGLGAVFIIFLNSDHSIVDDQIIDATTPNFGHSLIANDNFGQDVCSLGDLVLGVAAPRDDDVQSGNGALYIVNLGDYRHCDSSPCGAYGACILLTVESFECQCNGATGTYCEIDVNDCDSNPCQNGVCIDAGNNAFTCDCTDTGFEGDLCQTEVDECISSPCLHDGTCLDTGVNMYTCTCVTGWEGDNCETQVNECDSSPCQNLATCIESVIAGEFTCECADNGFNGTLCDEDIDDCIVLSDPCMNNGTCSDAGPLRVSCACLAGFTGEFCEVDVDDCASSPCGSGAACVDQGTLLFDCTDIDDCASSPCGSRELCIDQGADLYTCENIDACLSSPCVLGQQCLNTDISQGYTCHNQACSSSPCYNGATCIVDSDILYTCQCMESFSGLHCDVNLIVDDETSSSSSHYYNDSGTSSPHVPTSNIEETSSISSSSSFATSSSQEHTPPTIEILIEVSGFAEGIAPNTFASQLPDILAADIGGIAQDYSVVVTLNEDGSYLITIGYYSDTENATELEAKIMASDGEVARATVDAKVIQSNSIGSNDDDDHTDNSNTDDTLVIIIILVVVAAVLVGGSVAFHLNNKRKATLLALPA